MSGSSERPDLALSATEKREMLARLLAQKAARPRQHPLSFAQQRLWFLDRMSPGTDAYNVWSTLPLSGPVSLSVFAASLREMVRRHTTLRTTFTEIDGEAFQVVAATAEPALLAVDLTGLPAGRRQDEARRVAGTCARAPFDLSRGPLLRTFLLRIEPEESLALAVMHHIVSDAWSMHVLLRELRSLYAAFSAGRPSPLPPLAIQYTDFAQWQRQHLQGTVQEEQIAYWRERLRDAPVLEMPTDRPRPPIQSFRGAARSFAFGAGLREALVAIGQREGATPFMVLLAALQALLHLYTGQEEICIGAPVTNRERRELQGLIGFFVNTLVLRVSLAGDPGFRELLRRVRETALGAFSHQDLPFERLVEELQPRRDVSRSVLFQVAFALQNVPDADALDPAASPTGIQRRTVKFELNFEVSEGAWGIAGLVEYNCDLFDGSTIQRLLDHFGSFLEAAAATPEAPIGDLALMSSAQRQQLLHEWNDAAETGRPPACLHELIEEQAQRAPESVAVAYEGQSVTYRELSERANQLAHQLRRMGVGPEVRVGIAMERSPELMVALLGTLKAGAAYVPFDLSYPAQRLAQMAEDAFASAESPVVVTQQRLRDALPGPLRGARTIELDRAGVLDGEPKHAPRVPQDPGTLAYVIFTSGSTGRPKGAMNTHRAIVNRLLWMQAAYGLGASDRVLQKTPFGFDVSVWELFWPLLTGARLVFARPGGHQDPAYLARLLAEEKITTVHFVPSMLQVFLEEPGIGALRSLRRVIASGEALSPALVERFFDRLPAGAELHNLYGPTEAAVDVTAWPCGPDDRSSVPIGRPVANTSLRVLDRVFRPVPVGVAGELHLGGVQVGRGYLGRPALTAERFIPDPFTPGARLYRTGDLARWRADGAVEYLGRIDHQVKIRGFRIEPGEIEAALARHPAVREAVVLPRQEGGETVLAAFVVPAEADAPAAGELRTFLRERLPEAMVPAAFVPVPALPLTANGKLDRAALLRIVPGPGGPSEETVYIAPSAGLEEMIAAAWREVLGLERVGVRDNFFDLGGHSLKLAAVHSRLRRSLDREVSIVEMFQHPTIESLARHLEGGKAAAADVDRARARAAEGAAAGARQGGFAVVGLAGRFPGARNVRELWENLRQGVESIVPLSEEDLRAAGVPPERFASPSYVRAGAVLDGIDLFDADFFGFSPREAEVLDPQQRLFLECAWEALENAGYDPRGCDVPVGVYAGAQMSTYMVNVFSHPEILESMGLLAVQSALDKDFLATRVSYALDLQGPSLAVQTACSTSLVAVHLACQALRLGECDMALAGGVTVRVPGRSGYLYQEAGILSPDGHCRAFDAEARGTVFGSGLGIVVLKRLEDALRDGDTVHAVILGSALNNDGSRKVGYTAPGVSGQAKVIAAAQAAAGVSPDTITYIETHGTGTALGDPIEVAALTQAFRSGTDRTGFCALGSVKTNLGHLDAAAGITGLIKAVLALEHGQIPPSLHFSTPNPKIDFASSPFRVNAELAEWHAENGPRRAGVSSFGIGGTNAHAVLEEAPPAAPSGLSRPAQLLVLSARTSEALEQATDNLAGYLAENPGACLPDVAYTLQAGRHAFAHRRILVCADAANANTAAEALATRAPGRVFSRRQEGARRPVVFLFPGQGAQHPGMGRDLYAGEPVFRREVDTCAELLLPRLGRDLREVLLRAPGGEKEAAELRQTALAQPALFVVEYALARLWMSWGIEPWAMIGHSLGEYVAACLAGVFSLADALDLVAARGELMQSLPPGAMLSADLPEDALGPLLAEEPELSLAAVNGPALCVVAGPETAVAAFAERLAGLGVSCRRLHTSHAFHSAMVEPILAPFTALVAGKELRAPAIPYLSNLTGGWITAADATSPESWARHLRSTVRFAAGMDRLMADAAESGAALLEVGPGRTLSDLARQAGRRPAFPALSSMPHPRDLEAEPAVLLQALGRLWLAGVPVDWRKFAAEETRRRLPLPGYPFQRRRFWIDAAPAAEASRPAVRATEAGTETAAAEMRAPRHGRPDLESPFEAPRGEGERRLVAIWEELLGVEGLGIHDDFFELGGHSLLATRVISRVRQAFQLELPLESLFEAPTVARFAVRVAAESAAGSSRQLAPPIVRVPRTGELPLSYAQQRLLFLDLLARGDVAYNLPLGLRLAGPLDPAALRRALVRLILRHEVLRTTFRVAGGRSWQVVAPEVPEEAVRLPVVDLTVLDRVRGAEQARQAASADAARSIDLSTGPVLRALLLRLSPAEHVLAITVHHIAGDGWSWGILLGDLVELYEAAVEQRTPRLPEIPVQYADFAAWQRGWLQGEVLDRELAYWQRTLADLPRTEIPSDRPRPELRRGRGAVQRMSLGGELVSSLRHLGREEDATLFMVLVSAFCVLLHYSTGDDDLILGTDVANRNRSETEGILGLFVNQLVLRNDLSGDPSFREILRRVRGTTFEAFAHQDAPFDKLVEVLNPARDMSRTPLFQVKLVLQNTPMEGRSLRDLEVALFDLHNQTAKFDLLLNLNEAAAGISGTLEYDADLYEPATIQRLLEGFGAVLTRIADQPDARLGEIEEELRARDRQAAEQRARERQELKNRTIERVRRKAIAVQG
jgi:amino acid adenylation domain-containing protein